PAAARSTGAWPPCGTTNTRAETQAARRQPRRATRDTATVSPTVPCDGSNDLSLLREMTGDGMVLAPVDECGLFLGADVLRLPTAGPEPAPRRRMDRARDVALQDDA